MMNVIGKICAASVTVIIGFGACCQSGQIALQIARLALLRAVKQVFNPAGILNPGKVLPE
jgi:hypothetical protein